MIHPSCNTMVLADLRCNTLGSKRHPETKWISEYDHYQNEILSYGMTQSNQAYLARGLRNQSSIMRLRIEI